MPRDNPMPASKLMGAFRVVIRRERHGGAGGIRTHEWRFCRPLPWATWVPRRIFKYSKSARTLWTSLATLLLPNFTFFLRLTRFLPRARIARTLQAVSD